MKVTLCDPEQANLLAIILHRLLTRAEELPADGVVRIRAGGMVARMLFGPEPRVESREGPADCSIEASFGTFIRLALGGSCVRAWFSGAVRLRGNPFRALSLVKVFRCRS